MVKKCIICGKNFRVKVTALGIVLMNAEILLCTQMR